MPDIPENFMKILFQPLMAFW